MVNSVKYRIQGLIGEVAVDELNRKVGTCSRFMRLWGVE